MKSASAWVPLSSLAPGQPAVVTAMHLPEAILAKLVEMGLGIGRHVRYIRSAPLGDPIEIELMHYRLALRVKEASGIRVRPLAETPRPLLSQRRTRP